MGKKLSLDLLIFDLDGTLVDSMTDIVRSANFTLQQLGWPPLPAATIQSYVGDGIRRLVQRCLAHYTEVTPEMLERALDIYFQFYDQHCTDHAQVYPGVMETLVFFQHKKKVVLSNKGAYYTQKILQALGLAPHFDLILGGDSLDEKKPHPQPVFHILDRLKVVRDRAMIIGDSPQDIQSGKAAGIFTCGVLYGYRPAEMLTGADYTIRSMLELQHIVAR
ncbi:MAG: HAD-IA family hydrolase [Calditrichaeota bacterium]|nr:HAD-IA family hydrolase [Calditrichota bacterium]